MLLASLDVIVKAGVHVLPEKGHLGYCKYPGKTNHSLLEIFRHTDYVP